MHTGTRRRYFISGVLLVTMVAVGATGSVTAQSAVPDGEWHHFGRDGANTKYSPLDQITAENFTDLEIAWRWTSLSRAVADSNERIRPSAFKSSPLMANGLVYVSTALGQVAALDAGTGEPVWTYDPRIYDDMERPPNMGWHHRGLSYWKDDESDDARIFMANHDLKLVALNARTGALYPDFGENGYVDLTQGYGRKIDASRMTYSSPVAIAGDTIITGSIVQDTNIRLREASPGDVRAYDARTGEMKWIFHTIPQGDEFGVDSWQNESWRYSGHANVWSYMAVDEELGYVYLPTGTPSNDWYGGMRPGNNLFAESIVAVDIETGQRVWHFQAIHHGLFDWDFPTGPNLLDITVDGREIKALAQVSKQAFTYVFDRVTGEPVWPIEERPVPQGNVPGEWYSPTQPFPTKPPPFDRQGISIDDLIDFTPELRAEAIEITDRARFGPLFSPPVLRGAEKPYIQVPGAGGGANWQGAAVDVETGRLFISSSSTAIVVEVIEYPPPATIGYFTDPWGVNLRGPQGLPLFKPPFKRVTAIDLNTGDQAWMTPHGDGPRNHPALRDLNLPPLGGGGGITSGPLVTPTLLIMNHGGRDYEETVASARTVSAYDKDTGEHLGSIDLPAVPGGNPVTYMHEGKQYLVIAVGNGRRDAELLALTLP
ncbi:MAG: pyrroloquinoline quinone-dependent dehydrogenase [Acidobacteria bacterium]|nr:pyrroloquinoline quinone-dependent dehydrogenase [Acidobacteriota bacterium]